MVRAVHFYPRSPCGERPHIAACGLCDLNFYPRSPCGERLGVVSQDCVDALFLSTLSLRRATRLQSRTYQAKDDFYPRSPCGERRDNTGHSNRHWKISIHALLAESDVTGLRISDVLSLFLFTLSLRRATHWQTGQSRTRQFLSTPSLRRATCLALGSYPLLYTISIHALLAESDAVVAVFCHDLALISIHALLAESDWARFRTLSRLPYFYPRSPCGERLPFPARSFHSPGPISIHAL